MHATPSSDSSRCGGGGDGGESRGRAFSGSDARTAPPHEVQLQARQAPHPHRYGRPSPSSSSSPSSAAAPRCSWCRREGKAAACRGSLSGSAALPVKSWLFSYFTSCTAFVAKKHGFVLHTGLSAISWHTERFTIDHALVDKFWTFRSLMSPAVWFWWFCRSV